MKLLSNIPIEDLTPENDYLGIIEKGDMITSLLKSRNIDVKEIKMFALYGNWGSGKSTLMKYLQKELKDKFNTFYFDAWQYENGRDLSYSLLEFMYEEGISDTEKTAEKMLDVAKRVLIGTAKGFTFKTPVVNFNTKELMNELEDSKAPSFHSQIKEFKTEFEHFEGVLYQENGGKKKTNIVFIDDLDRCEPEKVLDLLSEIKLFFTYGVKTIFFFGVDQKAVEVAIKTKYGSVVKSNEYLEKIFDLTFSMPKHIVLYKLIGQVFGNQEITQIKPVTTLNKMVTTLFSYLKYDNPRKIKKILNKYQLLQLASNESTLIDQKGLINSIKNQKSALHIIYALFLLILLFSNRKEFEDFGMNHKKDRILFDCLGDSILNASSVSSQQSSFEAFIGRINVEIPLYEFYKESKKNGTNNIHASELAYLSLPVNVSKFHHNMLKDKTQIKRLKVESETLSYRFTNFLFNELLPVYNINDDDHIELGVKDFKDLIEQLG